MYKLILLTATIVLGTFSSAEEEQRSYFYPVQHRSDLLPMRYGPLPIERRNLIAVQEPFDDVRYEYTVISKDEYSLADSIEDSIYRTLSNPFTALTTIASKGLKLVKFLIPKALLILLGMGMMVGVCACTSFCTITIEPPFSLDIPYLDYVEKFLHTAISRYENMQLF